MSVCRAYHNKNESNKCKVKSWFKYWLVNKYFVHTSNTFFQRTEWCFISCASDDSCFLSCPVCVSALPPKSEEEVISNGVPGKKPNKGEEEKEPKKPPSSSSLPSKNTDVNEDDDVEYIEKSLPKKQPNVNQFDENTDSFSGEQQTKAFKTTNGAVPVGTVSSSPSSGSGQGSSVASATKAVSSKQLNSSKDNSAKKGKNYWKEQLPAPANFTSNKDEHISRWVAVCVKIIWEWCEIPFS